MERKTETPPAGTHPTLASKRPLAEFLHPEGPVTPMGNPSGWGVKPRSKGLNNLWGQSDKMLTGWKRMEPLE